MSSLYRVRFTPGNPVPYDKSKISSKSRDKRGNAEDKIAWEYGAEKADEIEGCDFVSEAGLRCEVKCGRSFSSEIKDRELTRAYCEIGLLLTDLDRDHKIMLVPKSLWETTKFLADRSLKLTRGQLLGKGDEPGAAQILRMSDRNGKADLLESLVSKFTPSRLLLQQNNVDQLILADNTKRDGEWFLPISSAEEVDSLIKFQGFYKGEVRFARTKGTTKLPLISKYDWLCKLFTESEENASLTIAN